MHEDAPKNMNVTQGLAASTSQEKIELVTDLGVDYNNLSTTDLKPPENIELDIQVAYVEPAATELIEKQVICRHRVQGHLFPKWLHRWQYIVKSRQINPLRSTCFANKTDRGGQGIQKASYTDDRAVGSPVRCAQAKRRCKMETGSVKCKNASIMK